MVVLAIEASTSCFMNSIFERKDNKAKAPIFFMSFEVLRFCEKCRNVILFDEHVYIEPIYQCVGLVF
jgi:hypothetical protein